MPADFTPIAVGQIWRCDGQHVVVAKLDGKGAVCYECSIGLVWDTIRHFRQEFTYRPNAAQEKAE